MLDVLSVDINTFYLYIYIYIYIYIYVYVYIYIILILYYIYIMHEQGRCVDVWMCAEQHVVTCVGVLF